VFKQHGKELPGLKRLTCTLCGGVSYSRENHEAHMMLHTGDRHACGLCDYESRYLTNVRKHRKKVHGGKGEQRVENGGIHAVKIECV
jgi:hypothetical protein